MVIIMQTNKFVQIVQKKISDLQHLLPSELEQYKNEDFRPLFTAIRDLQALSQAWTDEETDTATTETRDYNVGFSNYAANAIQPWDIWIEYGLTPWDGDIIKRTLRSTQEPDMTPQESRILDYRKIQHISAERIDQINAGDLWYQNVVIPPWVTLKKPEKKDG